MVLRTSSADHLIIPQHLGPSAAQVIAERNLSLPVVIFSAADAHVRIAQAGNVTAQEAEGREWREMEEHFPRHQGTRGLGEGKEETNEAVIGGEPSTRYCQLETDSSILLQRLSILNFKRSTR